jgi:electron transfer flavoprotein alpha subunit
MSGKILTLIELQSTGPKECSLETLAFAKSMADQMGHSLHALVLGYGLDNRLDPLPEQPIDSILLSEDPKLADYDPDVFVSALEQVLRIQAPQALVFPHTYQTMDLAPKLAARQGLDLISDCTRFQIDGAQPSVTRQVFRGKLQADIALPEARPWLVTVQEGAFRGGGGTGSPPIEPLVLKLSQVAPRRRILERLEMSKGKVDLSKAEVIVGIGRGIKTRDNMEMIEALADSLSAEIGASRPVVDNEWLPRDRQIGSSGQSVAPRLYFALGISGAIQHVVGIKNASCIVAINADPNAPIFSLCNYGIVGDLTEIVPLLTEKIREL